MSLLINTKKLNFVVLIGLALIISALSIWVFSAIELKNSELILTNQNVGMEELWQVEGALQWWNNVYATVIVPATTILALTGIAAILSPKLFVRYKQKHVLNNFEKELQKACKV
jgi:uncharacterized membrane protein (DUF373 family)